MIWRDVNVVVGKATLDELKTASEKTPFPVMCRLLATLRFGLRRAY